MDTDRRARFEQLYEAHVDQVMRYCLRHVAPAEAEDAVADTFTVAWRRFDELPDEPIAWLLATARNHLLSTWRRRRRADELVVRLSSRASAAPSAEVTAARRAELVEGLASLDEAHREALLLTCWDNLSTEQAAQVLGCTPGALRVRVHRARASLAAWRSHEGANHG